MRAELKILADSAFIDVLPPEGFPTVQVKLDAIPWCTAHNSKGVLPGLVCDLAQFAEHPVTPCVISTGGPDHEWWRIT